MWIVPQKLVLTNWLQPRFAIIIVQSVWMRFNAHWASSLLKTMKSDIKPVTYHNWKISSMYVGHQGAGSCCTFTSIEPQSTNSQSTQLASKQALFRVDHTDSIVKRFQELKSLVHVDVSTIIRTVTSLMNVKHTWSWYIVLRTNTIYGNIK